LFTVTQASQRFSFLWCWAVSRVCWYTDVLGRSNEVLLGGCEDTGEDGWEVVDITNIDDMCRC
jgi:hypothetical protein